MKTYLIETAAGAIKMNANNIMEALGYGDTAGYLVGRVQSVQEVKNGDQGHTRGPVKDFPDYSRPWGEAPSPFNADQQHDKPAGFNNSWIELNAVGPQGVGKTLLLDLLKLHMGALGLVFSDDVQSKHRIYVREDTVKRLYETSRPAQLNFDAKTGQGPDGKPSYGERVRKLHDEATTLVENSPMGSAEERLGAYMVDVALLLSELKP
jgi:hypothetical protein